MLNNAHKRHLKALIHGKKPIVTIGTKGLTDSVLVEIDQTLTHHELIKIRVNAADHEQRDAIITRIGAELSAELVQRVGHVATFFRSDPETPRIVLP